MVSGTHTIPISLEILMGIVWGPRGVPQNPTDLNQVGSDGADLLDKLTCYDPRRFLEHVRGGLNTESPRKTGS